MTINKHLITVAVALAVMCCTMPSCKDLDDGEYKVFLQPYSLTLSSNSLGVGSDGTYELNAPVLKKSTITLAVTASSGNQTWKFTSVPNWISVTPMSGTGNGNVKIEIQSNPDYKNDRAQIIYLASTISEWDHSVGVRVMQKSKTPSRYGININSTFSWAGDTRKATFSANYSPTVESTVSWLTASVTPTGETDKYALTVTAQANYGDSREGSIRIKYFGETVDVVTFTQLPKSIYSLKLSGNELSVGSDGTYELNAPALKKSTITLAVTASSGNQTWKFTSVPNWISVTPMSGTGNGNVKIEIQSNPDYKNDRAQIIYLASTISEWDHSVGVRVMQKSKTPSRYGININSTFSWAGDTRKATFSANYSPTVESTVSWLTASVTPTGETDKYALTVTAQANYGDSREGSIRIKYFGETVDVVTFTQLSKSIYSSVPRGGK